MNHYIDSNPYPDREHDQQIHTVVASLRPQEQLRKNRKVRGSSRLFALVKRGGLLVGTARRVRATTHCAGVQTPNHKPR
jgi:hypothetical protein